MPIKQRSVAGKFDDVVERLIRRLGEGNVYRKYDDDTIVLITDIERLWMKADSYRIYSLAGHLKWQASCRSRIPYGVAPALNPTEIHIPALPRETIIQPPG